MKAMSCINCHSEWLCPTGDSVCVQCGSIGIDLGQDVSYPETERKVSRKPCPICKVDIVEYQRLIELVREMRFSKKDS